VLVAAGLSNPQVARSLGISHQTVARHLTVLMAVLDVPNRAALVSRACHRGLIDLSAWPPVAASAVRRLAVVAVPEPAAPELLAPGP